MHEMEEKVNKLCDMKEKLVCLMENELAKGACAVDTKEAGEVIDMIKDLAEAEEKCWKACYYKAVVEAMEAKEEMPDLPWYMDFSDRAGYDNYRYSDGRFAPKGRGTYSPRRRGYMKDRMPKGDMYWDDDDRIDKGYYMGYDLSGTNNLNGRSDHSRSYDNYKNARRHYTETHSPEDKKEMDAHAKGHLKDTIDTVKDIWSEADPELRKQMKQDLTKLVSDMS